VKTLARMGDNTLICSLDSPYAGNCGAEDIEQWIQLEPITTLTGEEK